MTAMVHLGMIAMLTLIVPGSARTLNATEVEGLVVRESNASTACGRRPGSRPGLLAGGLAPHTFWSGSDAAEGTGSTDDRMSTRATRSWPPGSGRRVCRCVATSSNRTSAGVLSTLEPEPGRRAVDKLYAPLRAAFARNGP